MARFLISVVLGAMLAFGALAQEKKATKKKAAAKPAAEKVAAAEQPKQIVGDAKAAHDGKIAMCIGCHGIPGYKTAFPDVYHVPKIAGQQAVYIVNALKAYKSGERSHPSMRGIAASLTDQDMADLAAYYGAPAK
jgi:cytochrome c553